MQAQGVGTPAPPEVAPPPVTAPEPVAAPSPVIRPGVAPSAVPAPLAASRASATKTMFGIPAPELPQGFVSPNAAVPVARAEAAAPVEAAVADGDTGRTDRITKTGARKVAVPAPEIQAAASAAPARRPPRTRDGPPTSASRRRPLPRRFPRRTTRATRSTTKPTRAPAPAPAAARPATRQAPIWTYVGVGFTFGLVLLGIYQLVGRLAH